MLRLLTLCAVACAGPAAAEGAAYYPSLGYGQAIPAGTKAEPPRAPSHGAQAGLHLPDGFFTGSGGVGAREPAASGYRRAYVVLPGRR
jgi:hypothetical protein